MDNLRGLLSIRRMDKVPNARIRELHGVTKEMDESINEICFRWFGYTERMGNDRISKMVYVGECVGRRLVGWSRKRWTDTAKDCSKKVV